MADYSILTPYKLPPGTQKKVNAGDGFIMDSCEKLIGRRAAHYFSSRARLEQGEIEKINSTAALVVAGANTLHDEFTPAPEFTANTLRKIQVPVVLMGLGHYGVAEVTQGMKKPAVDLIAAILERFPYMSVRCGRSHAYVTGAMPDALKEKILMTSCPVAYAVDGVDKQFERKKEYELLVVTITDRTHLQEQAPIIPLVKKQIAARRYMLALHQDYENAALHEFARGQGYEIFTSPRYEDFIELYKRADLHVGNRVHGHLKMLSLNAPSFLLPYDLRQQYFAESLDFPLLTALPSAEFVQYDFARFAKRREQIAPAMKQFVTAIHEVIGAA